MEALTEGTEVAEPAENGTATTPGAFRIPIIVSSNSGIIKTVSWNYYGYDNGTHHAATVSSQGGTITMPGTKGAKETIYVVSQDTIGGKVVSYDGIVITGISFNSRPYPASAPTAWTDNTFNVTVSANKNPSVGKTPGIQMTTVDKIEAIDEDNPWTYDGDPSHIAVFDFHDGDDDNEEVVTIEDMQTAFSGKLKLKVVSSDIINTVKYDVGAGDVTYNVSDNTVKEFEFENQDAVNVKLASTDLFNVDSAVYTLSFNGTGHDKKQISPSPTAIAIKPTADGDVEATFSADVKPEYKSGKVRINVLSENDTNKVSINAVQVKLGDYAVKWNTSDYASDQSNQNKNIKIGTHPGYIDVEYKFAKDINIAVKASDTLGNADDKYYFQIGAGKDNLKKAASDSLLAEEYANVKLTGGDSQTIDITPTQVRFNSRLNMNVTSNNMIKSFTFKAYKKDGTTQITGSPFTVDSFGAVSKDLDGVNSVEFYRGGFGDSGTADQIARGYVVRVKFGDKEYTLDHEDGHKVVVPVNADGSLPDVEISAVPNKYVTLSANANGRKKTDKFTKLNWKATRDKYSASAANVPVVGESYVTFKVEQGAVVSVNSLIAAKDYLFPYVAGISEVKEEYGVPVAWTLGKIEDDASFDVDTHEYALKDAIKLDPVINLNKGSVSIDEISVKLTDNEATSTLSNNEVFDFSSTATNNIKIKFTNTDALKYELEKFRYTYYGQYGEVISSNTASMESDGVHAILPISNYRIKGALLKNNGVFRIEITAFEKEQKANLTLKQAPDSSMKSVTVFADDAQLDKATSFDHTVPDVAYGKKLTIKADPAPGYKLVSVNIMEADKDAYVNHEHVSHNKITNLTDAKDIAAFTGAGYAYTMGKVAEMKFTSVPAASIVLAYEKGNTETDKEVKKDEKKGQYVVNHKRPVVLQYKFGASFADFDYDVIVNKKSILDTVSKNGVVKSGSGSSAKLTFDGSVAELVGKVVTIKMTDKKGENAAEVVFAVDAAKTGITFKKSSETMPLGTTQSFSASVVGVLDAVATVSGGVVPGVDPKWDASKKSLTIKTTVAASAKKYVINLVDKADSSIIYGTLEVALETDTVKNAPAPVVKVTGTTNHKVTLSFKQNKVDVTTDHLFYKVNIKIKKQTATKNYYSDKEVYVPVSKTSETIDILKDEYINAMKGKTYDELPDNLKVICVDSDPDAEIEATVQLVQKTGDDQTVGTVIVTATSKTEVDSKQFKLKEGSKFETKLRLTKNTKGQVWNNYGNNAQMIVYADDTTSTAKDVPYIINVVYSKDTGVQELSKVELLDKDGNVVAGSLNYFEYDNYSIKFKPNVGGLNVGDTYQIKAYALEPNGMDVTAVLKVKIERAIHPISLEGAPEYIYKTPGKAAKAQVTAYDQNGVKAKKVEYAITKAGDGSDDADPFASTKMVKIGKSNGKIAINKNLVVTPENQTFYVKVTATDNKNVVTATYSKPITIKTKTDSDLYIAVNNNYTSGTSPIFNATALAEIPTSGDADEIFNRTYYTLFDNKGHIKDGYDYVTAITVYDKEKTANAPGKFVPSTIKVSGGAKVIATFVDKNAILAAGQTTYPTVAILALKKAGQFKINVTADDGSDRKIKNKVITVNPISDTTAFKVYNPDGNLNKDGSDYDELKKPDVLSVNNYSPAGDQLKLEVYGLTKKGNNPNYTSFMPNKVSAKGGKITKFYKNTVATYYVQPTDAVTTVTIKNTAVKGKADTVITIYNKAIAPKTNKSATKVTAYSINPATGKDSKGKVFSYINFTGIAAPFKTYEQASCNKVTYNVTGAKSDYVLVNLVKYDSDIAGAMWKSALSQGGEKIDSYTYAFKLNNGAFYIEYSWDNYRWTDTNADGKVDADEEYGTKDKFDIKAGSYKFTVTPVKKADTKKYEALGKAGNVTASFAKAPKANVKPVAKVAFSGKTGTIDTSKAAKNIYAIKTPKFGYKFRTGANDIKGVNTKGTINNFAKNFTIDEAGKMTFTGAGLPASKTSLNPKDKTDKLEFTGWVSYEYQNLDGTVAPAWLKVTIDTKGAELKK